MRETSKVVYCRAYHEMSSNDPSSCLHPIVTLTDLILNWSAMFRTVSFPSRFEGGEHNIPGESDQIRGHEMIERRPMMTTTTTKTKSDYHAFFSFGMFRMRSTTRLPRGAARPLQSGHCPQNVRPRCRRDSSPPARDRPADY